MRLWFVPGRIDMPFPGDHVVERGADPGIACPDNAIFCGTETNGLRTLVALRPIRHGARVGGQEGVGHPGALENAGAQQLREAPSRALLQDIRQDPKILVAVGVAGARRKLELRVAAITRAASTSPNGASAGAPCSIATAQ